MCLIGIEGDEGHIGFAKEACAANGFSAEQVTLHYGIAAAVNGVALFPREEQAGVHWGLEPVFVADEAQRRAAVESGRYDELPMIALSDIAAGHRRIDLLHIDIQGGEADFIASSLQTISEKVAYMVVGTHSRQLEGKILALLLSMGWILEIERPAIFAIHEGRPQITVDGIQGWRNPRFASRLDL